MPRRVMFIGKLDAPEFQSAVDWLRQQVDLQCLRNIAAAIRQLGQGASADTILVAPSHRSEFRLDEIRQLQAASPLSHLYAVVGSWSEGETRSGNAWPGIERLYVHQLIPRARADHWDSEPLHGSASPCTASSDERWMSRATKPKADEGRLVLVCGHDTESRAALVDLCRWAGLQAVSMKSPRGPVGQPATVIYDADRNPQQRHRELQRLATALPDSRLLTLIEHPRYDEIHQALDAGSDHVLGKPYDIDDLLALVVGE